MVNQRAEQLQSALERAAAAVEARTLRPGARWVAGGVGVGCSASGEPRAGQGYEERRECRSVDDVRSRTHLEPKLGAQLVLRKLECGLKRRARGVARAPQLGRRAVPPCGIARARMARDEVSVALAAESDRRLVRLGGELVLRRDRLGVAIAERRVRVALVPRLTSRLVGACGPRLWRRARRFRAEIEFDGNRAARRREDGGGNWSRLFVG